MKKFYLYLILLFIVFLGIKEISNIYAALPPPVKSITLTAPTSVVEGTEFTMSWKTTGGYEYCKPESISASISSTNQLGTTGTDYNLLNGSVIMKAPINVSDYIVGVKCYYRDMTTGTYKFDIKTQTIKLIVKVAPIPPVKSITLTAPTSVVEGTEFTMSWKTTGGYEYCKPESISTSISSTNQLGTTGTDDNLLSGSVIMKAPTNVSDYIVGVKCYYRDMTTGTYKFDIKNQTIKLISKITPPTPSCSPEGVKGYSLTGKCCSGLTEISKMNISSTTNSEVIYCVKEPTPIIPPTPSCSPEGIKGYSLTGKCCDGLTEISSINIGSTDTKEVIYCKKPIEKIVTPPSCSPEGIKGYSLTGKCCDGLTEIRPYNGAVYCKVNTFNCSEKVKDNVYNYLNDDEVQNLLWMGKGLLDLYENMATKEKLIGYKSMIDYSINLRQYSPTSDKRYEISKVLNIFFKCRYDWLKGIEPSQENNTIDSKIESGLNDEMKKKLNIELFKLYIKIDSKYGDNNLNKINFYRKLEEKLNAIKYKDDNQKYIIIFMLDSIDNKIKKLNN